MKKALKFMWLAALVLLIFSLMLTACNGGKDRDRDNDDDDDEETTEAVTDAGTDNATDTTESADGTTDETKEPEIPKELGYRVSENKTYCIVIGIGNCTDSAVAIPNEFDGLPVKEIADGAFSDCLTLKALTIPDSVILVGVGAFDDCPSLEQIYLEAETVPEGLEASIAEKGIAVETGVEAGHSFGTWNVTKEAECETAGSRYRECSDCGKKDTEDIPETGHTEEIIPAVEATKTETGLTEGKKCTVCKNTLVEQEVVPALGNAWDGTVADSYAGGSGTESDPYRIATPEQLARLSAWVNGYTDYNKYYILTDNIDLGGREWNPIGCGYYSFSTDQPETLMFCGHFDGQGHTVSNFKVTKPVYSYYSYYGLFGTVGGTIKNLGVENFTIDVTSKKRNVYAGGIAGRLYGTVENCYAIGTVNANAAEKPYATFAGVFAGEMGAKAKNCYAIGEVNAISKYSSAFVGGFVGASFANIENCYAAAKVSGSVGGNYYQEVYAGAFAGEFGGDVTVNCFATGDIDAIKGNGSSPQIGGFGGSARGDVIATESCYRYSGQKITINGEAATSHIDTYGVACTADQLNSADFYKNTLKWSEEIWDFSELDFDKGALPKLK